MRRIRLRALAVVAALAAAVPSPGCSRLRTEATAASEPRPELGRRSNASPPGEPGRDLDATSTDLDVVAGWKASRPTSSPDRNSDHTPKKLPPGPFSAPPHTLVLPYDAFGPQVMSFGLLGMGWWQWEGGGSFEPGDTFDVRVVVYRDLPLATVEAMYPTIPPDQARQPLDIRDHRYVEYAEALRYIDDQAVEITKDGDPALFGTRDELLALRRKIVASLGP